LPAGLVRRQDIGTQARSDCPLRRLGFGQITRPRQTKVCLVARSHRLAAIFRCTMPDVSAVASTDNVRNGPIGAVTLAVCSKIKRPFIEADKTKEAAKRGGPLTLRRPAVRLFQLRRDAREGRIQTGTEAVHRGDNCDRDSSCNQTVLNGGSPALITQKCVHFRHLAQAPDVSPRYSCTVPNYRQVESHGPNFIKTQIL
jgi:hypothetical protein